MNYNTTIVFEEEIETYFNQGDCKEKIKVLRGNFTKDEAVSFILTNYACCFISAEENNRLNKAGFNSKRPDGWKDAYRQVDIEFILL